MAEQIRGPFEKFVDWRQCAAVMQREAEQRRTATSPWTFQTALVFFELLYMYVCLYTHTHTHRISQEEVRKLWEDISQVILNKKNLY
jgi:hypothetical protein